MTEFSGSHILARLEDGKRITVRNRDNICSATIAASPRTRKAAPAWEAFLKTASKEMSFADALAFFQNRRLEMTVSG
jgi:hypothetical protein